MTITLNHAIVPAVDHERAAAFFAGVMGLDYAGPDRHFVPVRVNDQLTLDFMTAGQPVGLHLAFDGILARLRAGRVPYRSEPEHPDNGRTDHPSNRPAADLDRTEGHPLCARGLFFVDEARNLDEVMSPA